MSRQFFRFFQIYVLYRCKKSGLIDFPEKRTPTKVKYCLPICQILRNFTEGNARKFTVSFAFCTHVDVIKYRKTLTFSFGRAQTTSSAQRSRDRKTIGSHLKVPNMSRRTTAMRTSQNKRFNEKNNSCVHAL